MESTESPTKPNSKVVKISNKYTTERLMMMLDKEKLEALEEEFEAHPEGIEHQSFIWYFSISQFMIKANEMCYEL